MKRKEGPTGVAATIRTTIITYLVSSTAFVLLMLLLAESFANSCDECALGLGVVIFPTITIGVIATIAACFIVPWQANKKSARLLGRGQFFAITTVSLVLLWGAAFSTSITLTKAPSAEHAKNVTIMAINAGEPSGCNELTEAETKAKNRKASLILQIYEGPFSLIDISMQINQMRHRAFLSIRNNSFEISGYNANREKCQELFAIAKSKPSVCPDDDCLFNVASYPTSRSTCDEIQAQEYKTICLQSMAMLEKSIELCEKIESDDENRVCISHVAGQIDTPERCTQFTTTDDLDYCWLSVAGRTGEYTFCKKIQNQESRDRCLYSNYFEKEHAEPNTDPEISPKICDRLGGTIFRINCYQSFTHNSGYRDKTAEECPVSGMAEYCFLTVAAQTRDEKLCESIKDSEVAENCKWYVTQLTELDAAFERA